MRHDELKRGSHSNLTGAREIPAFACVPSCHLASRPSSESKTSLRMKRKATSRTPCMRASDSLRGKVPAEKENGPLHSQRDLSPANGNDQDAASGTIFSMAIANEFSIAALYRRILRSRNEYAGVTASATSSALRIVKPSSDLPFRAEAFVFPYGCIVVWGSDSDGEDFLSLVVHDAYELRDSPVVDKVEYAYGESGTMHRDIIILEATPHSPLETDSTHGPLDAKDRLDPTLERLAISCGLAQSIKLSSFESEMRTTIENTRHLPEELAYSGEITTSRREVSRLMGQLFLDRYRYHLSGDLLMTPTFFWEHKRYLPTYRRVERYLGIRERGDVLNKRVQVVQELFKHLGEELSHQNSAGLELAITVMIAFEILLTLITIAKQSMQSMFSACALFSCLVATGWAIRVIYRRRRYSKAASRFSRPRNGLRR